MRKTNHAKPFNLKEMKSISTIFILLIWILSGNAQSQKAVETGMDKMWGESTTVETGSIPEKAKLFADGNFGMFIHWGLYSHLGGKWKDKTYYGIGEWIKHKRSFFPV